MLLYFIDNVLFFTHDNCAQNVYFAKCYLSQHATFYREEFCKKCLMHFHFIKRI